MIQIATVGDTQEVVKMGLGKILPEKLYILHTANERTKKEFEEAVAEAKKQKNQDYVKFLKTKQYEDNVKSLKKEIQKEFGIPVELKLVHKYESNLVIETILDIIHKEQDNKRRNSKDYVVNITGGTKAMVAGASCGAYLAQARMYYVLHPDEARGKELVRELPVPSRAINTSKGEALKTTGIILSVIRDINRPCSNKFILDKLDDDDIKFPFVKRDSKTGKEITEMREFTPQLLSYHLGKLEEMDLIEIEDGFRDEGKKKKNRKLKTITIKEMGKYYADYPEILGYEF